MPPHNIILGHLPILIRTLGLLPKDAHPLYLSTQIRRSYPDLGPNFYLDVWPFAQSMLVIGTPDIMHQIAYDHVLKKTDVLKSYLRPLTDGLDMVSMDGAPWKKWRSVFNPGFSPTHLMTLIPLIVRETEVYCGILDDHASRCDIFSMKSLTDNLILDVIGQVALGVQFNCQQTYNQIIHSLRTQIKWLTVGLESNPLDRYNPFRPLVHWYHGRIVNNFVSNILNQRLEAWHNHRPNGSASFKSKRTVIDLAISAYAELQPSPILTDSEKPAMDAHFKKMCQSQLKVFLFSGHDTTSSAICFHLWLLSQNLTSLQRLRDEHTQIFGADPSAAATAIATSPHLLNQLPYTAAVIKESLRLFPTVTISRTGEEGFSVVDAHGRAFPTDYLTIWPNQHSCHRDPAYWPEPESFIPERWTVPAGDPLYPIKGVWRAFEQGPRSCIAQELAMLEMKIVLVLVSRRFVFVPAYDEVCARMGRKPETVMGQQAYQAEEMGPKGGLPMRVERLSESAT